MRQAQRPAPRTRTGFEARSVQILAAWTLAMAGAGTAQTLAVPRTAGAAAPPLSASATGSALPPLPARLPRK
jgi:hypothetical protein